MSKTSWQVKARYNAKAYGNISVRLPKELVDDFKNECASRKVSQAQVFKKAIEDFINKEPS